MTNAEKFFPFLYWPRGKHLTILPPLARVKYLGKGSAFLKVLLLIEKLTFPGEQNGSNLSGLGGGKMQRSNMIQNVKNETIVLFKSISLLYNLRYII